MAKRTPPPPEQRLMPHDNSAEESLLGAMLASPRAITIATDAALTAEDFYTPSNAHIYAAVLDLHTAGTTVDVITVAHLLEQRGLLDICGGQTRLVALTAGTLGTGAAANHTAIIGSHAEQRRIIGLAAELDTAARDGKPLDTLIAKLVGTTTRQVSTHQTTLQNHTYTIDQLDQLPEREWLIDGIIPKQATGVIWGPSSTYKSFIALHIALSIAAGIHVLERRTEPATVLYVAAEGGPGMRDRIAAWRQAHADTDPTPYFHALLYPPPLGEPTHQWAAALAEHAQQLGATFVVVDTVARTFGGGNENETQHMSLYVDALGIISRAINGAVTVVHHAGIDKTRMRGSTVLYNDVDFVLGVHRPADGWATISNAFAANGKAKDAEEMSEPAAFRLDKQGASLVATQRPHNEVPATKISGDGTPRTPRALASDKIARMETVVYAIKQMGGMADSTQKVADAAKFGYEKAARALVEAARAGLVHCVETKHTKTWHLGPGTT